MPLKFEFGDRVRHCRRPEWGVGAVVKVENVTTNGEAVQRVQVRFPNAGMKTLSSGHAELERVDVEAPGELHDERPTLAQLDRWGESDWLGPMARRKIEEVMTALPPDACDPFARARDRLKRTVDLYRFESTGRSLMDWAAAQSGLADPLSRFTRHELEQYFERWSYEREQHLKRLLQESELDAASVAEAARAAPSAVRRLLHRNSGAR